VAASLPAAIATAVWLGSPATRTRGGLMCLRIRFREFESEVAIDPQIMMNRIRRFFDFIQKKK